MGFFSDLKDKVSSGGITASFGGNLIKGLGDMLGDEQDDRADQTIADAQAGVDLKREQAGLLREDIRPLRELRNSSINELLKLQGIGQPTDRSAFFGSPEFRTVRDAALEIKGASGGMNRELAERADQLAMGGFGNYQDRIFNTAGFSAGGVGGTNQLLQQNVDAQANLLNNAGAQAASNMIGASNQRGQAASGILGLLGAFCDARLKRNIRKSGTYDIGINKYSWEWTEEAKQLVGDQPAIGPLAHEVHALMPWNIDINQGYLYIKDKRFIH